MQTYNVVLSSEPSSSYRATRAADSVDLDLSKKLTHNLLVTADVTSKYNVGLIIGASGSGKTTLAKQIYGEDCFNDRLDLDKNILDQFPVNMTYDDCVKATCGMGLTQIPCWVRPVKTLSTGQKARASAALNLAYIKNDIPLVVDEWTSTVDRNVARVMSHSIQKYVRKIDKQVVLLSCHYDIVDWLNPDWVIDCNKQEYIDRRSMVGTHQRTDQLRIDIREISPKCWKYFSKYHYLSANLPGGKLYSYGLFLDDKQIAFVCYTQYVPRLKSTFYFNRLVVHPDYVGLGIGINFVNKCTSLLKEKGFNIRSTFASKITHNILKKHSDWKLIRVSQQMQKQKHVLHSSFSRKNTNAKIDTFRHKTKVYTYAYIGS